MNSSYNAPLLRKGTSIDTRAPRPTGPVLLHAENLACERDQRLLFECLDLTVRAGEAWRVVGPNGAGKTTLLRLLAGLNHLHEGVVKRNAAVAWLGHLSGLKAVLSPRENLGWFAGLQGADARRIDPVLAAVGLRGYEDQPCHCLSAGQQRRVALARLLLQPGGIWILDEPFAALDVDGVGLLETLFAEQLQRGGALVFSTHQDADVELRGEVRLKGSNSSCERIVHE